MAKTKMRTVDMSIVPEDVKGVKTKLPKNTKKVKTKKEDTSAVVATPEVQVEQQPARKTNDRRGRRDDREERIDIVALIDQANGREAHQEVTQEETEEKAVVRAPKERSKKYKAARAQIDRTKNYDLKKAVEFLKKTSYSHFAGTVSVDAITKDDKLQVDVTYPHSTGRTTRVVIATDEVLAAIDKGIVDFDVLIATPQLMPKLAKYARVLGPKGLMPNPKNGTVTADPEKRLKELSAGKTTIRTEKKAPLLHAVVGKTTMEEKELVENIDTLIKAIGGRRLKKLVVSATMSPGIKIDLSSYQAAA